MCFRESKQAHIYIKASIMEIDEDDDVILDLCTNEVSINDVDMSDDELFLELKQIEKEVEEENHKLHVNRTSVHAQRRQDNHGKIHVKKEEPEDTEDNFKIRNNDKCTNGNKQSIQNNKRTYRDDIDHHTHKDDHRDRKHSKYDRRRKTKSADGIDRSRLNRHLEVTKSMDPMVVGREIAYRLHETKLQLIGHVVRVLGVNTALEIFEETKDIFRHGGLKTDVGDRKRTPGGIYLYVLKNRAYASEPQIKEIFKHEKTREMKRKKRKKREAKVVSKYLTNPPSTDQDSKADIRKNENEEIVKMEGSET